MFNRSMHKAILFLVMFLFMVGMARMANASPSKDIERLLATERGPGGAMDPAKAATTTRISLDKGYIAAIGTPRQHYLPVNKVTAGNSAARANSFMQEHRAAFGIESDALNLITKQTRTKNKREYVRFRQTYDNLPVFAAEVIVQLNESGNVTYVLSDVMRNTKRLDDGSLSVSPAVSAQAAQQIAFDQVSDAHPGTYINVDDAVLVIYRPAVVGNTGFTRLVWQTIVTGSTTALIDELILIDAHSGKIALQFSQIKHAKVREVFDSNNTSADPGTLRRSEGDSPSGITDVDDVYDFLGDTYNFYLNQHGRDGLDGAGNTLSATVRYCDPDRPCPYVNAFWNGTRMYYGEGMGTDDITGHELTHGVTQYESDLIYLNESGAINESFSDIWGEFVDLTNGAGTDTPAVRWYIGEDAPIGAIRNMADPPEFNDPDRKSSPLWHYGSSDNGGVHTNSGVANKLCYLLTDGSTFNGHTITGIGISSTADLFYEAQCNLLTQSSDYANLYDALIQAAINLGWSAADQANVNEACLAVELDYTPPTPPNDECIDAISVNQGIDVNGTTIGATDSGIATSCAGNDIYDVWYSYTPTASGNVTVSLCGSDYDTALAIFDSCGGLELACNDDSCDLGSEITAGMTAGTTCMIRVSGYSGATGNFILLITGPGPPPAPPNDECIDAITVTEGIAVNGTTIGATDSGITTSCAGNDIYDVWYSYTPTVSGDAAVTLSSTDYDSALAIFDSCGGVELACNDNPGDLQSAITLGMTAGATCMIRVSGHDGATGNFILVITRPAPLPPPPNDECIDAISVAEGIAVNGTTIGATDSGITTSCAENDIYDVWYSYTQTVSGDVTVTLSSSDYDSALAIFDSCGGVELACNDNPGDLQSEITLGLTAGATCMIRVSGYDGATGNFMLLITGDMPDDISDHVRQISMSTTYHYTTDPIRYTFDADVDLHAGHSVREISVQRPDGQTYAMTLDSSDPSEPYYEFGAGSHDLSDLAGFDSGLFTFTITYTDDSTETTSVLYADPGNGEPVAPVTQEPLLNYPVDGQTDVPLKMGFQFDACTHPDWTIGIECEPQDGSAPALQGSLPYDARAWGVWNWGGTSLLPNRTYDAELTYDNAYSGINADGIPFVVDKDAQLNITFTTTSDTSPSVSDHVFNLEISKGLDYNDPRRPATKRYVFHFQAGTDDTIQKIEFVTHGNDVYLITQAEELCVGDDSLDGYRICAEYETNNGRASWHWEIYALKKTGTRPFGNGEYLVRFYYSDTEYYQTTIDYAIPGTTQPMPRPKQKPNITSPGNVTLVPSSFAIHWDLCTDQAVNKINGYLADDYRGLLYSFHLSPDTTSSPLITPMHGNKHCEIEFAHEYFLPDNGNRIPLTISTFCSINHMLSVSRYDTINIRDFAGFADESGRTDCDAEDNNGCNGYDLDNYGQVDIRDLALLLETWLLFTAN